MDARLRGAAGHAFSLALSAFLTSFACGDRTPESPTSPTMTTAAAQSDVDPTTTDPTSPDVPPAPPDVSPAPPDLFPVPPDISSPAVQSAVLVGAGAIAMCDTIHRAATTARLMQIELNQAGVIGFTLGDNSNDEGRPGEYANCFGSTWGRFTLKPSPGNHDDYDETVGHGGAAYYQFFGAQAGPPNLGYYSYAAGSWHVVSLNSEIINRSSQEAAQLAWLKSALGTNAQARCILAYFHRPMVSSGEFAAGRMVRLWRVLYDAGVDVIINGHEHFYERFAPQTPDGDLDPVFGVRQFIVGTGGARFHRAGARARNSEVVIQETLGIIRLTLQPTEYVWEFIDIDHVVRDSGAGRCQGKPLGR